MTTLAQIKKIAKGDFIPEMKARGFSENSKSSMTFFREVGDAIHHIISFDVMRGGNNLRVYVFAWVPELKKDYDVTKFPKNLVMTNGRSLLKNEIGIGLRLWNVEHLDAVQSALDDILVNIDSIALPWLDAVNTREELVNRLLPDYRDRPNFPELKEAILNKTSSN